ncbi:MAG: DUF4783 domain-containing protein [Ignavibacteriaceae bacterium]|nr:DUF4783 domain-containing protein [Ignavibacteriaceae bacterium]
MEYLIKDIIIRIITVLALFIFLFTNTSGNTHGSANREEPGEVFSLLENSLNSGDISSWTKYISSQTYLSLSNGESGYFSASQAYYILQDFFKNYKVISFKFRSVNDIENPYGIAALTYEFRNRRVTAQVFVSLTKSGNNWQISQFTVK